MRSKKTPEEQQDQARRRAELIVQVQSGRITATEAARQLGVSRKTYYEWEHRALSGMIEALQNKEGGRPSRAADPEKETLKRRVKELQAQKRVREQVEHIREVLKGTESSAQKK